MPILRYENLTHAELAGLPRSKTVVFLPTGPLEQHGPHLPLGADAFSATYFTERMAERLHGTKSDWNFVLFPTFFAGCDTLTYTGTVEISPKTMSALLTDCCKQLARDGFRTIVAVSAHGGPRHMVVLEEIAARMRWRYRTRMISASARVMHEILDGGFVDKIAAQLEKSPRPLSDAERAGLKNDYHGGLLETSLMLVAKPELVKPMFKELRPAILDSVWKLRRNSGQKVGEGLGHLGSPALARPEIGTAAAQVILDDVAPLIERFLEGEDVYKKFRSKFYYFPIFRTHFKLLVFLAIYIALMGVSFMYLTRAAVEHYK